MPPAMCKRSRRAVVASHDPGSFASLSNVTVALKPFLAHHCFAARIAMQHCTLSKFHSRSSMHFFNASRTARPEFLFKLVCGRYSTSGGQDGGTIPLFFFWRGGWYADSSRSLSGYSHAAAWPGNDSPLDSSPDRHQPTCGWPV